MPALLARTGTYRTARWLRESKTAGILHLFDHSCNLKNERGDVLSIVDPAIGPGPFNLVLARPFQFSVNWDADTPVLHDKDGWRIGGRRIDTERAADWNPLPKWASVSHEALQTALPILRTALLESAIMPGINAPRLPETLDDQTLKTLAENLAGRGPGLTPSGDDVLMGWMHAFWIRFEEEQASTLCRWMAEAAVPRTTTLSGAWLAAARQGEAGQPWHRLVQAIRSRNTFQIQTAAIQIIKTGHSSGADAMAGFLAGME